jgi:hypothetical protein
MQNYLGYDMRAGTRSSVATKIVPTETRVTSSPEIATPQTNSEPQTPAKTAAQSSPLIEFGACVMGVHRQTAQGVEFLRPIPVYRQGGSVEAMDTMREFSAFYAAEQHSVTGEFACFMHRGFLKTNQKLGKPWAG